MSSIHPALLEDCVATCPFAHIQRKSGLKKEELSNIIQLQVTILNLDYTWDKKECAPKNLKNAQITTLSSQRMEVFLFMQKKKKGILNCPNVV